MPETWLRSSTCDTSACVQVADIDGVRVVRSSTDPTRTVSFTEAEWIEFLAAVRRGEFG